jgi:hypothetical protein
MKAVVYHADSYIAERFQSNIYKHLFKQLKENLHTFNVELIHLTLNGHEGWGDQNYFFDGDPKNITYNREYCFVDFLKTCPEDTYWFTEPDTRINNMFPMLSGDLALLMRATPGNPIPPAWRLAKKSALPFFEEILECLDQTQKGWWEVDTAAFEKMAERMGNPKELGQFNYNNMDIELRNYKHYCMRKSHFSQQFKGQHKKELCDITFLECADTNN